MDLELLTFPFVTAIITNSVLIVLMYFLRKSKYFANIFGIGFMVALYLLCVIRMLVPIEFPHLQIRLRDTRVYAAMVDFLKGRSVWGFTLPYNLLYALLAIWAAVSAVLLVRLIARLVSDSRYIAANRDLTTPEEAAVMAEVSAEVFRRKRAVALKRTDAVSGAMVIGFWRYTVLLPDIDCSPEELRVILRHECMHIKDGDVWIKLLAELYCVIFWWNPFAYLLKLDLNDTLETRCDLHVIRNFGKTDKALYAATVIKFMSIENACEDARGQRHRMSYVYSHFSQRRSNRETELRFVRILDNPPSRGRQTLLNILVGVLFCALFLASYLFIWQPYYRMSATPTDDYLFADEGLISDNTNAYLVKQADGNYIFYFNNEYEIPVTEEEFNAGLYEGYPILSN